MAAGLRGLFRLNLSLAKSLFSKSNCVNVSVRTLFLDRDLGINSYESSRFVFRNQFISIEDTFRAKMKEICDKEDGVVFTEDLKAMIHLAQSNEEDLTLITEMFKKFIKQKRRVELSSYVFGPPLMRMLYYLNKPQKAIDMFKDPELTETFMYHSSIKILVSLLYKHQMYQEIRDALDTAEKLRGKELVLSSYVVAYAACLKENTPEAAEYAIKQWKEHCKIRSPSARATCIVACIAIKNNTSDQALEMLSTIYRDRSTSVLCLKLLAYTQLGRYLQIIPILKHLAEQDLSISYKFSIFADVICELEEKLKQENSNECAEIMHLLSKLKEQQKVESKLTLEEYLLRSIQYRRQPSREGTSERTLQTNYSRNEFKSGLKNFL